MNLYQRLKDVREDADLTQKQVAEHLEMDQSNYAKYENGHNMMGIDKYIKLARLYNISLDYLAGIIDEPRKLFDK